MLTQQAYMRGALSILTALTHWFEHDIGPGYKSAIEYQIKAYETELGERIET